MNQQILFKNKPINFKNSFLINYYINNSLNEKNNKELEDLLVFRCAICKQYNEFSNNSDGSDYVILDFKTNKFKLISLLFSSLESTFIADIVSFEYTIDKTYIIEFKKDNQKYLIEFSCNELDIVEVTNINKKNLYVKDYISNYIFFKSN